MTITAYFSDKIEREVSFYETRMRQIDERYLVGVEKLAKQTPDKLLAEFFRNTVRPDRIASALDNIRVELKAGQIVEADKELEHLKRNLRFVEDHLKHPIFRQGLKFSGDHGPRLDVLARLIDDSLDRLGPEARADAVLQDIHVRGASDIQEITEDKTILWRSPRGEKTTTFKSFQNRLGRHRKLFHKSEK